MAVETTAATGAMYKLIGVPLVASAVATSLGFMFLWPKSPKEAAVRIGSTILFSTFGGPVLVAALHAWSPELFAAARELAILYGLDPSMGFLFVAAPVMVVAGLPAWWILGAFMRWFEKRKTKDIGELARDAFCLLNRLRGVQ